jgi:hypothetical protein
MVNRIYRPALSGRFAVTIKQTIKLSKTMKKTVLVLTAILAGQYLNAQNTPWSTSGPIGIGTTTPSLTLNVDPQGPGGILIGNPSTGSGGFTSLQFSISAKQNGYAGIQSIQSSGSAYGSLMLNPMGGNVGIGTTNPAHLLDVNGVINAFSYMSSGLGFYMEVTKDGINNSAGSGYLSFRSNNVDNQMIIDPNGNVGIATINTHGFKFAVNGSAIATSVTVQAYTSWPDYVFKTNYTLPTLTEVKTYIDQNHHLPEIPTAEQIEEDGLNLGEMNKLLVKKVEELTLYLIELNKQVKQQQKEIEQLKKTKS